MTLRKQVKYQRQALLVQQLGKSGGNLSDGSGNLSAGLAIIEMIANLLLTLPAQTSYLIPGISDSWLLSFAISVVMAIGFLFAAGSIKSGHHLMVLFPF